MLENELKNEKYRHSLAVFNGDSSSEEQGTEYECVDAEGTDLELLEEELPVMPVEAMSTSCRGSSTTQYTEFLMCDTRVTYQHAGYHLKISTSRLDDQATEVSTSAPGEGVLRVVTGRRRLLGAKYAD